MPFVLTSGCEKEAIVCHVIVKMMEPLISECRDDESATLRDLSPQVGEAPWGVDDVIHFFVEKKNHNTDADWQTICVPIITIMLVKSSGACTLSLFLDFEREVIKV